MAKFTRTAYIHNSQSVDRLAGDIAGQAMLDGNGPGSSYPGMRYQRSDDHSNEVLITISVERQEPPAQEDTAESLSNRERRLRDAVADLPEPFPTTRERSDSEAMSRHLTALRYRLDVLVKLEDQKGEDQNNLHRRRAERNALIWALTQLAPIAEGNTLAARYEALRWLAAQQTCFFKGSNPEYHDMTDEQAIALIDRQVDAYLNEENVTGGNGGHPHHRGHE